MTVNLKDGRTIRGLARNESDYDLQLQDLDGAMHFLSRNQIASEMPESKSIMPPLQASAEDTQNLLAFLSRLGTNEAPAPPQDSRIRLETLPFSAIADPKPGDWPTYNGR